MVQHYENQNENNYERFSFSINPEAPLFIIGVTSEMVDLPIWTLRKLDEFGVVKPKRVGRARCYSKFQIQRLHKVRYLLEEKRVNISSVKVVLELTESKSSQHMYRQEEKEGKNEHYRQT